MNSKNILVTGASGFLGSHVIGRLLADGHRVTGTFCRTRTEGTRLDLISSEEIASVFQAANPDVAIHVAAMADLKPCEDQPELARRINATATAELAQLCRERGARMIFFSTDQVFDGQEGGYTEYHAPNPIHMYGRTKAEAEDAVLDILGSDAVVVRVAIVYGSSPTETRSCTEQVLRVLERGERPRLFTDEIRTPVLAEDVASATAELAVMKTTPRLLHLGGPDRVSRYDIGCAAARAFGHDTARLEAVKQADLDLFPPRPPDLSMKTSLARGILSNPPRTLEKGLAWLAGK
jgi:dTDP-4-dehydrorhamnose reductase